MKSQPLKLFGIRTLKLGLLLMVFVVSGCKEFELINASRQLTTPGREPGVVTVKYTVWVSVLVPTIIEGVSVTSFASKGLSFVTFEADSGIIQEPFSVLSQGKYILTFSIPYSEGIMKSVDVITLSIVENRELKTYSISVSEAGPTLGK